MNDATGIQALNNEHEAARFNEALNGYFRVSTSTNKRPREHGMLLQPAAVTPDAFLKQLKQLLRDAAAPAQSQYIHRLHRTILHQMKSAKMSPTVFSRAVELCREIFKRSAAFRALITTQTRSFFDQLLLSAGEDPSANVSRALRARSRGSKQLITVLALIETWKEDFGDRYPSLVAGHGMLVERGYAFPHERERQQEERERDVDTRRHRERVNRAKQQQRDQEMKRYVPEMEQVLVEMNRVFEILVPTLDAFHVEEGDAEEVNGLSTFTSAGISREGKRRDPALSNTRDDVLSNEDEDEEKDNDGIQWEDVMRSPATQVGDEDDANDDVEWENVAAEGESIHDNIFDDNTNGENTADDRMDINDIVQAYGLGSSSYQLTIEVSKQVCQESSENDALFRSLADGALRMRKRFLPLLDDWDHHSTLNGSASGSSNLQPQREVLQRIRELRGRMTRALLKWDDLVQGSKQSQREVPATRSAVVSLPLDAYNPPTKRRRQFHAQS